MILTAVWFILMCWWMVWNAEPIQLRDWYYDEIHRVTNESWWGGSDYILMETRWWVRNIIASCKRELRDNIYITVDWIEYIRADMCYEK